MDLQRYIRDDLWKEVKAAYESGNYKHAILDAIHVISDSLRGKSGVDGDGLDLVKELDKKPPTIRLNKLLTQTDQNEQRGIAHILRGMYTGIRNPRSHELYQDSQQTADAIIHFVSYLLDVLDTSQEVFSSEQFIDRIIEPNFVSTDKYVSLLVDEIPQHKLFETLTTIYQVKSGHSGKEDSANIAIVMQEILKRLAQTEKSEFFNLVSEELKRTKSSSTIRQNLQIIDPSQWVELSEISRLRIENRILKEIELGRLLPDERYDGWLATWAVKFIPKFSNANQVASTLCDKLAQDDAPSTYYVLDFFMDFLLSHKLPTYHQNLIVKAISEAIITGDHYVQGWAKSVYLVNPWKERFHKALEGKIPASDLKSYFDAIPF